jgi:hypothetical protein
MNMKAIAIIGLLMLPVSDLLGAQSGMAEPPTRYGLKDVTITLDMCKSGPCPSYVVSIHGDGRVSFEGRKNVNIIGRHEVRVDRDRVIELLGHIYSARFFSLGDNFTYGQFVSAVGDDDVEVNQVVVYDSSPTTLTVTIAGYQKSIAWDPFFSPKELSTLRDRILEIAEVQRWLR